MTPRSLTAALFFFFATPAFAQEASPRFSWDESVGFGVWLGTSNYDNGSKQLQAFTINSVSFAGIWVSDTLRVGLGLNLHLSPVMHVGEDRSSHKDVSPSFAVGGLLGPAAGLKVGPLLLEASAGFLWIVVGAAPGGSSLSFGGVGVGVGVGATYRKPLTDRLELVLGLHALGGLHFSPSDKTQTTGGDFVLSATVGIGF